MPKTFKDKNNNVLYTGYETNEIVANPTLAGTESELTGIQIGNTKYKAPEGFSGDYNDLTNKPTIPTVNNPTITFTQGGVNKGSFTLNQSNNKTIALDAGGDGGEGEGGEGITYNAAKGVEIKDVKLKNEVVRKFWNGLTFYFSGMDIWTDGENVYGSCYENSNYYHYVLDKTTSTWLPKTWKGFSHFIGSDLWTDGENIYCSDGGSASQYVLNKATSTWSQKRWTGLTYLYANNIWTDGENIYYSPGSDQYVLDKATSTWLPKTWTGLSIFSAMSTWTDGENIYYSAGAEQYVLDKATSTWLPKTWTGFTNLYGVDIWTWKGEAYYFSSTKGKYTLNRDSSQWIKEDFIADRMSGRYIWTDGEHIYYSERAASSQYEIIIGFITNVIELENKNFSNFTPSTSTAMTSSFQEFSFNFQNVYYWGDYAGSYIWTDGENIYYSYNDSNQFVLDKATSTWSPKTWTGFTNLSGYEVWTDGENIYYSYYSDQYVLDKATSTWLPKTWTGLTQFYGNEVWTDGEDIYYGSSHVLDKATSTWLPKTWNGLRMFAGEYIWTDGENIYYSNGNYGEQYVLDKATSTWLPKTWYSLLDFNGREIWTDGENIYYSGNLGHYVLNKVTSTWVEKKWNVNLEFHAESVFTDGNNVYLTTGHGSISDIGPFYKLTKPSSTINARPVLTSGSSSSGSSESSNTQAVLFSGEDLTKEFLGVTDAEATTIPINYENLRKILSKEGYDLIDAPIGEGTVLSQTGDIFKLDICPSVTNPTSGLRGRGLIGIYTEEVEGSYNLQIATACPEYGLGHIDNYTVESGETENLGDILTKVGAAVETTPEDFNEFTFLLPNSYYRYSFSNLIILYRESIDDYEFTRIKDIDTFIKLVFKSSGGGSSDGE